jgi:hypothetical protein
LDGDQIEPAIDEHVVHAFGVSLHHDVRIIDRTWLRLALGDRGHFGADAKLEAAGRRERSQQSAKRVLEPAGEEFVGVGRRTKRTRAPQRELSNDRPKLLSVFRQLVDAGGGRRRQGPFGDDAGGLEVTQAGGEDVRPDSGQVPCEVGVALRACHQLAHDEQRPPLADQIERVGDRAVVVVVLWHVSSVAEGLVVVKSLLVNSKYSLLIYKLI